MHTSESLTSGPDGRHRDDGEAFAEQSPFVRQWEAVHEPEGYPAALGVDEVARLVQDAEEMFDRARAAYRDALGALRTSPTPSGATAGAAPAHEPGGPAPEMFEAAEPDLEALGPEPEDEEADAPPSDEATELEEELEAVDPFPLAERLRLETPLLSARENAQAVAWNLSRHPGVSGLDPALIRARIERYVNMTMLRAAMIAANLGGAAIASGTPPLDSVFAEAVHQFQRKCFIDPKQADGLAGESTLDSLGLTSRSRQFNSVDRVHVQTQSVLRGLGGKISPHAADTWYEAMENPTFLGWTFTNGIHAILSARLRAAERHLLTQPTFRGKTPAELGVALGIREQHRGARPHQPKSRSVHTAGLAVDINYAGNPWIAGSASASAERNKQFTAAVDRATLLAGGRPLRADERLTSALLHALSARPTDEIHGVLSRYDTDVRRYFGPLAGSVDAVKVRLLSQQLTGQDGTLQQLILPGEDVDAAARRWHEQIRKDRNALKAGSFSGGREPRDGFLNLDKALVVALRDVAGLAWGAVDFGPRSSGDVMHFDCRRDGVGRIIRRDGVGRIIADALGGWVGP